MSRSLWVFSGVHGLANATQKVASHRGDFIARFIFYQLDDFATNHDRIGDFGNGLSSLSIADAKTNADGNADFLAPEPVTPLSDT